MRTVHFIVNKCFQINWHPFFFHSESLTWHHTHIHTQSLSLSLTPSFCFFIWSSLQKMLVSLHCIQVNWTSVASASIWKQFFLFCFPIHHPKFSVYSVYAAWCAYCFDEEQCAFNEISDLNILCYWQNECLSIRNNGMVANTNLHIYVKVQAISTVDIHRKLLFYYYCCYFWTHFDVRLCLYMFLQ